MNQQDNDDDYLPSEEKAQLKTNRQVQEALRKSYEHTQKFWEVWSKTYLAELREFHKRRMEHKRTTPAKPRVRQIVLIMDKNQPRNTWKLGRIERIAKFKDDIPREAEIEISTGRIQKRPINLLIPLELSTDTPKDKEEKKQETRESKEKTHTYNLRPRRSEKTTSKDVTQTHTVGVITREPSKDPGRSLNLRSPMQSWEQLARGIASEAPEEFRATNELANIHKDMISRRCDQIRAEVSEIKKAKRKEDINKRLEAIEAGIRQIAGETRADEDKQTGKKQEAAVEKPEEARATTPPKKRQNQELQPIDSPKEEPRIGREDLERATAIMEIEAINVKLRDFIDCKDRKYDEEEEVELVRTKMEDQYDACFARQQDGICPITTQRCAGRTKEGQ
ncbi:hypothetical protein GCK32_006415 [Trichostrongylus colubriformis]|uniref:DUF5641 domain-containing protein n=1 Tax=Trichostrongylus colubriformis TaxID=6319 RepID=A0AAN8FPN5_TRICO